MDVWKRISVYQMQFDLIKRNKLKVKNSLNIVTNVFTFINYCFLVYFSKSDFDVSETANIPTKRNMRIPQESTDFLRDGKLNPNTSKPIEFTAHLCLICGSKLLARHEISVSFSPRNCPPLPVRLV